MSYTLYVPGIEHRDLEVKPSGFIRGPRLLLDGQPAPRGPKRHQYILTRNDGSKAEIRLKPHFLDPVPKVIVDGEQVELVEPLSVGQWVWSGLPLILLFAGGALGGFIGASAVYVNIIVFRSKMSTAEKYILTGLVSGIAVALFLIAGAILPGILYGLFD